MFGVNLRLLVAFVLLAVSYTEASLISVSQGGVYDRVTLRIADEAPRQFCRQIIENAKVGQDNNNSVTVTLMAICTM